VSWTRAGLGAALLTLVAAAPGPAQEPADSLAPPPRISIVTFGPGAILWEKFGHNMIRVTDPVTGTDLAYNFGIFDTRAPNFYWNFVQGRPFYALEAWAPERTIAFYISMGRSVEVQELSLTPAQARALAENLARNALPENSGYRYDYYRDNCSTRVRDAINLVVVGAIEQELSHTMTTSTYRSRTADLTADRPFAYFGLMLLLGPATDERLNAWEESFIPMDFARHLASVEVAGRDSVIGPLVASSSSRPATGERAEPVPPPSDLFKWFQLAGLLLGAGLAWAGVRLGAGGTRTFFLVAGAAWSLLSGLAGFTMVYLWAFTDHVVAYRNENILQASVLGLVMFAMLARWARRGGAAPRGLSAVAVTVAVLSLAGVGLKFIPGPVQQNWVVIAFFLPVNLGMALGALRAVRRPATTTAPT